MFILSVIYSDFLFMDAHAVLLYYAVVSIFLYDGYVLAGTVNN